MKTKLKKSKKNYRHEYLKYFNTEYKRDLMRALELLLAFCCYGLFHISICLENF